MLPLIVKDWAPAVTSTEAPSRSIACSSSSGVLVAVPAVMLSASRFATPTRPRSSRSCPPLTRSANCTSGTSRSSIPRMRTPLSSSSVHTSGAVREGDGPNGGSTARSIADGVRASPRSTSPSSASAPITIGSSTTCARADPSSASSGLPRGTKLVATKGRPLTYAS